ncbi:MULTISPECIES: hypothetical protein [Shewanella]|uniref:Transposase Helix-turn-helix domain-containing protein n=1 Tax=Shewanella oncorhynchi TaxID=2726434 RepID=A0ABX1KUV5_9GAMM|nr:MULTISPECIES: hypothetical protein [Shewanella]NLQ25209.1 hypothetical protein [Shewanella oncorhynchi]WVI91493.1 hypothetical protein VR487_11600 [Shewanella oncorhynchi]
MVTLSYWDFCLNCHHRMIFLTTVRKELKTLYFICVYLAVTQVEFRAIFGICSKAADD